MKPILFNTEMVKAILEGRKTVTRRVVKPQPDERHQHKLGYVTDSTNKKEIGCFGFGIDEYGGNIQYAKPPYRVGDILYVRETWCKLPVSEYGNFCTGGEGIYYYKADGEKRPQGWRAGWKPSIHMPKEAARLFLRVTGVRVERLQDITEEQAKAEGVCHLFDDLPDNEYTRWCKSVGKYPKEKSEWSYKNYLWYGNFGECGSGNWRSDNWEYQYSGYDTAKGSFSSLWESTLNKNQIDTYGWNANPYVWVIEFEDISEDIKNGRL